MYTDEKELRELRERLRHGRTRQKLRDFQRAVRDAPAPQPHEEIEIDLIDVKDVE